MPRTDDYFTNELGSSPQYDLELPDLGLNFYGDHPVRSKFGPSKTTAPGGQGETPLIFNDFSNGMGMAYSGVPNTYAFGIDMFLRGQRKAMPAGLRTEISLDDLGWDEAELAGEIRCARDFNGDVLIGAGQHILTLISGTGDPSDDYDVGDDCQIDTCRVYNGIPIFSTDQSFPNWQYLTAMDSGIWKTATDGIQLGSANPQVYANPVYLQKMVTMFQEVDGVGGNRIVGNDSPFTYVQTQSSDVDEIIGDSTIYSASLEAGDSSYAITGMYETPHIFFFTKADGVYGVESSGIYCPNYVPDMRTDLSSYNGISGLFLFGKLFVGTPQGTLQVDVASQQSQVPMYVNPSFYFSNETPIFGLPTAMTSDNGWLVVSLWNGRDSHILYGRPRELTLATVPNPMIWHGSECTIPGEQITMLHKTSVSGSPQILIGTHDGTRMHLYSLSVPSDGDPYVDYLHGTSSHQFATSGRLYLPFQDAGDPNAKKVIRRYDTQADGVSLPVFDDDDGSYTGITIQAAEIALYANADAGSRVFFEQVDPGVTDPGDGFPDSEWVQQGVISDSPKATMIPTLNTLSGSQIGVVLDWDLINRGSDEEPVYSPFSIRSIKIRTDVYVEQLEEKSYTVMLAHMQRSTTGGRIQGDVQTRLNSLLTLQDEDAVYMIDEWKDRVLVKVEPGMEYEFVIEDNGQPPSVVINFRVTVFGRQFFYDIGDPYDSVYAWGN